MSVEDNKRLILGWIENLNAGNAEALYGTLAETATWWMQGSLPVSGTKTKSELIAVRGQTLSNVDGPVRMTVKGITAEGDRVALESESYAKLKNGKIIQNTYHFLFVVRDGKIEVVRQYLDTAHAREMLYS